MYIYNTIYIENRWKDMTHMISVVYRWCIHTRMIYMYVNQCDSMLSSNRNYMQPKALVITLDELSEVRNTITSAYILYLKAEIGVYGCGYTCVCVKVQTIGGKWKQVKGNIQNNKRVGGCQLQIYNVFELVYQPLLLH